MIHCYFGNGKGKTTAAVGLAVRAAGRGRRVLFAQFLKGVPTGEVFSLQKLGVAILRDESRTKFYKDMDRAEQAAFARAQRALFQSAAERQNEFDLLVLDEIGDVCALGILTEAELLDFLRAVPESLEVVLTGRDFSEALRERARYVSRIEKIKHPYDDGVQARKGIEY